MPYRLPTYNGTKVLRLHRPVVRTAFYLSVFWYTILTAVVHAPAVEEVMGEPFANLPAYAVAFLPLILVSSVLAGVTMEAEHENRRTELTVPLLAYLLVLPEWALLLATAYAFSLYSGGVDLQTAPLNPAVSEGTPIRPDADLLHAVLTAPFKIFSPIISVLGAVSILLLLLIILVPFTAPFLVVIVPLSLTGLRMGLWVRKRYTTTVGLPVSVDTRTAWVFVTLLLWFVLFHTALSWLTAEAAPSYGPVVSGDVFHSEDAPYYLTFLFLMFLSAHLFRR